MKKSNPIPPEDEPGAQERFDRAIKHALATPPRPHKPKPEAKDERAKND